jgi:hypothetical protein
MTRPGMLGTQGHLPSYKTKVQSRPQTSGQGELYSGKSPGEAWRSQQGSRDHCFMVSEGNRYLGGAGVHQVQARLEAEKELHHRQDCSWGREPQRSLPADSSPLPVSPSQLTHLEPMPA